MSEAAYARFGSPRFGAFAKSNELEESRRKLPVAEDKRAVDGGAAGAASSSADVSGSSNARPDAPYIGLLRKAAMSSSSVLRSLCERFDSERRKEKERRRDRDGDGAESADDDGRENRHDGILSASTAYAIVGRQLNSVRGAANRAPIASEVAPRRVEHF